MKLHYHPISTTSRPVMLFAADHDLALDWQVVDLFAGEHLQPAFATLNPSCQVPVLEDGDFRLTESSAILKYLAERCGSPAYPADAQRRARIHERMDWFVTGLSRDLCYGVIYPQALPHYRRADDAAQAAQLDWHRGRARQWLKILDEELIGPRQRFVCGDQISLADYLGIAMVTLGEVVHLDYRGWRNLSRWIETMKARPHWAPVNEVFYAQFVAPLAGARFVGL